MVSWQSNSHIFKVLIVLYFIITSDCFFRNVFISLYVISPDDEAIKKFIFDRNFKATTVYFNLYLFAFPSYWLFFIHVQRSFKCNLLLIPVCTWSPGHNSDMSTQFPFSSLILAIDGKQPSLLLSNWNKNRLHCESLFINHATSFFFISNWFKISMTVFSQYFHHEEIITVPFFNQFLKLKYSDWYICISM